MMPRVIQVIESEVKRGSGVEGDPIRMVTQYHSLDGKFLAERDSGWSWMLFHVPREDNNEQP